MIARLALRSLRARPLSYVASAAAVFAGTALLTAFAALAETGAADPGGRSEALAILAAIMGGWTVVIVVFGIVSTVALVVRQRHRELALLRSAGATSAQVRLLVLGETLAVAVPAVVVALLPGAGLGAGLLALISQTGVVTPDGLILTWRTFAGGAAVSLVAALAAAAFAGRAAARVAPVLMLAGADPGKPVLPRRKAWTGLGFVLLGVLTGISTLAMPNGPLLAAAAGPACIATAIGLALLCPAVVARARRIVPLLPPGAGRLGLRNLDARAAEATTVVGPLILLIGIAAGTLYMQSTENSVAPTAADDVAPQFAAANYLVVAMIIAFSAIAVVNSLVSATWHRRKEFGLLRLTAATPRQVLTMVAAEGAVSALTATALGTAAAATTVVPYSLVRSGSPLPGGSWLVQAAIVGGSFAITFAATVIPAARALRNPPLALLAA